MCVRRLAVLTLLVTMLVMSALPAGAERPLGDDAVFNGGFEIGAGAARPLICEVFGEGYINVFDKDNAAGLPWLLSVNPCHTGAIKASGWTSGQTTEVGDFDNDGDNEVRFIAGSTDPNLGAGHNLWQAYPNSHQAYVGNFTSLDFTVESGEIPANAIVRLSFSTTPLTNASPWIGPFVECNLALRASLMVPDENGNVSIDPTAGSFSSAYVDCNGAAAAWKTADSDGRREILDGLRLVQHSYWSWNTGGADVVIDDISMVGSRTVAEAALS